MLSGPEREKYQSAINKVYKELIKLGDGRDAGYDLAVENGQVGFLVDRYLREVVERWYPERSVLLKTNSPIALHSI